MESEGCLAKVEVLAGKFVLSVEMTVMVVGTVLGLAECSMISVETTVVGAALDVNVDKTVICGKLVVTVETTVDAS